MVQALRHARHSDRARGGGLQPLLRFNAEASGLPTVTPGLSAAQQRTPAEYLPQAAAPDLWVQGRLGALAVLACPTFVSTPALLAEAQRGLHNVCANMRSLHQRGRVLHGHRLCCAAHFLVNAHEDSLNGRIAALAFTESASSSHGLHGGLFGESSLSQSWSDAAAFRSFFPPLFSSSCSGTLAPSAAP
eukprot:CAMPEP_0171157866 /NCGR_PEP_ID=MMETSP0790-20130122/2193_1 /TAXON_ID=2925 /ORGANISM="Alexandrium catenella, Strain OF101" /LENGTH=188 /DNA_ID=CAMNT_0011622243 /DNA_START=6 /DNA_END=571 /DNA_ORIENTATION=-